MQRFEDVGGLFHVYVTRKPPVGSSQEPWREKATGYPVDRARAQEWKDSIDRMIAGGCEWFVSCETELSEISAETYMSQLAHNVTSDIDIVHQATKRGFAHAALSQIIGSEGATQVIQGTYQGGQL